ncbi:CU044_5270 family protein [Actinacidiphila yeochonensis]|uniref:CU044_5270 family protein n=1 Tax=Actinacidiphila yeochonensis TaxID=89050 RepID=UPI00055BCC63|nr:CU044_5270 family protein [Actinacidiphila yeochonensis]
MNTHPRRRDQPVDHQDLAELLPAPGRPVLSQDRHRVLREHLMENITDEAGQQSPVPTPSSTPPARRRPSRRLVLGAAPLALAVVVGLGVAVVGSHDPKGSASASAVQHDQAVKVLNQIALAASESPAVTVGDNQYIYTSTEGSSRVWDGPTTFIRDSKGKVTGLKTYKGNVQSEEWEPVDGKREGLRHLVALSADGTPDPSQTENIAMVGGDGYLNFKQLQALPTDPDALLKKLEEGGEGVAHSRLTEIVFENVGAILDEATLLPDLDSALYRALAKLPDVYVVKNVKDAAGRSGIGLGYTKPNGSPTSAVGGFVFDAKTLTYLGTPDSALLSAGVADQKGKAPVTSS